MNSHKCPYCGNYGVKISGLYWAWCPECGAEGPKMNTEKEAWDEWDRVVNAIKTDDGKVVTDTNVGCKMPRPVKRDEKGPVSEKKMKELLAKVYEELTELQFAMGQVGIDLDRANENIVDVYDEWADTITALFTLADALGIDADERAAAIERCNRRNSDRGRL
jgi:predicted  nucleic acid-binding Zn-ribbon protein